MLLWKIMEAILLSCIKMDLLKEDYGQVVIVNSFPVRFCELTII